jgi:hypothetical protein
LRCSPPQHELVAISQAGAGSADAERVLLDHVSQEDAGGQVVGQEAAVALSVALRSAVRLRRPVGVLAAGGQEPVENCTIATTKANEFSANCDDRMLVIVDSGDSHRWLDPATLTDKLLPLLVPGAGRAVRRTVFTMDVALAAAGHWIVVDVEAGECSSLPPGLDPTRFTHVWPSWRGPRSSPSPSCRSCGTFNPSEPAAVTA